MLERIKKALVQSYVGAIAIGSLFAAGIVQLVMGLAAPFAVWLIQWVRQPRYSGFTIPPPEFGWQQFLTEWGAAMVLLLIAYLLLRWLYMEPQPTETSGDAPPGEPEESA